MYKTGTVERCIICGREFYVPLWWKQKGGGRYCSRGCGYISRQGKPSWNKDKKMPFIPRKMAPGFTPTKAFRIGNIPWNKNIKREDIRDDRNVNWKGDDVGYDALHDWVKRRLGFPHECEFCRTTEKRIYQWANKSGEYRRDVGDWLRLCVPCHKKYDLSRKIKTVSIAPKSKRILRQSPV